MVYLFIILALVCLGVKGYCGKKISIYVKNTEDSFLFNLVRMLFCIVIGFVIVSAENRGGSFAVEKGMIGISFLAGVSNVAFLVGWLLAVRKNTMITVDVALTIGSIIPAGLCALLFDETVSWQKMFGFGLIILATVILSGYNKSVKTKVGIAGILLLVFTAVGDGTMSFSQQLYKQYYTENGFHSHGVYYSNSLYHFYTYVFAALTLLAIFLGCSIRRFCRLKREERSNFWPGIAHCLVKPLPSIVVMAACLFAASYFQTVAASNYGMPSQILYPVMKGGGIIGVNLIGMAFFGEKLTKRSVLGSLVALCGIVAMNVL